MNSLNTHFDFSSTTPGILVEIHISVVAATKITGYNAQYLRRLLRSEKLQGTKIGQLWLIKLKSLEGYLQQVEHSTDQRLGPKRQ